MRKDLTNSKHTWVVVYAIDHGITWLFMQRTLAMSHCLEVTSLLDAEEGDVNIDLNA